MSQLPKSSKDRRGLPRSSHDRRSDRRRFLDSLGLRRTGQHEPRHPTTGVKGH